MAINTELEPCTWGAEDYWVRGIVDLLVLGGDTAYIVDYKTGSAKYPDVNQLKLMSLMTYAHFPNVKHIKAGLLFVAHNTFINEVYHRDQSEDMWKDFLPDLERLKLSYDNDKWPENPTPLCGWCPVTSCQFHKVR
jgi:RecB family exonuclease